MSAVDLASSPPIATERSLSGWGRVSPSRSAVLRPRSLEDIAEALACTARPNDGVIARGAGRSYGDAAQNEGGRVLDMTGWKRILAIDRERALITAQAGATIAELMSALIEHGMTLPVVPGTRHVTLAGAIASDIHGKNHHRDGGFARHVVALTLCTPARGLLELSPENDPELFYATLGGMGLTGVIVQATLRAEPLPSPWVAADVDRTDGLQETLELMGGEERSRYSVAWLDLLAEGAKMGRATISRADPLPADSAPRSGRARLRGRTKHAGGLSGGPALDVPRGFPAGLLRRSSVRAFNALRWHSSPRHERGRPLALGPYFFPLDVLGKWNRLYGPAGLIQYQFAIPCGQEETLLRCFHWIRAQRLPVYLAVFKRFGPSFGGPLSFPLEGWTLAIDLPADAPGLRPALQALDEQIAGCGGRVYLAKDITLRPETMRAMYPQLDRFDALRAGVDPLQALRSDLARRLELCGTVR
jgi:decaprenylphospho-beta-D-ribofuranose 2-oxidase